MLPAFETTDRNKIEEIKRIYHFKLNELQKFYDENGYKIWEYTPSQKTQYANIQIELSKAKNFLASYGYRF